ncbi:MAG: hypothetical protein LBC51_10565 [Treponema sp.]|jgi:hypothetical protein|nr:hypothetical protein [Treponema sp.]
MKGFLFLALICRLLLPVHAQTSTTAVEQGTGALDTAGFPQWVKDLRRGEIIAFGAFPFTMLLSNTFVDLHRSATHNWDTRYAPWPVKSAGAVDMTKDEQLLTIAAAAAGSVLLALIDFFIVRHKRSMEARKAEQLPEGLPIIIRKPRVPENREAAPPQEEP